MKTIKQYIDKIDKQISLLNKETIMYQAVFDAHNSMSIRIFNNGRNVSGSNFKYKEPYKNGFYPLFKKLRKKLRKKRYDSYAAYKRAIGIPTSFVNFKLTNELQSDFNNSKKEVKPIKTGLLSYKISVKRANNINKLKGINKRYGNVFKISSSEIDIFLKSLKKNTELLFAK